MTVARIFWDYMGYPVPVLVRGNMADQWIAIRAGRRHCRWPVLDKSDTSAASAELSGNVGTVIRHQQSMGGRYNCTLGR
jgi:hypothetical protein